MKEFQLKTLVKAIIKEALSLKESDVCSSCNGSGEGMADGTKCLSCKGSGVEGYRGKLTKRNDPDYDWRNDPDYDWDSEAEERKLGGDSRRDWGGVDELSNSPFGMNRKDRRDLSKKLASTDTSKYDALAKSAALDQLKKINPSAAYKIGSERQRKDFLKGLGAKVENVGGESQHLINGQSNVVAASRVNKVLGSLSKGIFSDDSWEAIHKIFNKLQELGLDYSITSTKYGGQTANSNMPTFKEWQISIPFTNKNGKPTLLVGQITAHGAGSVEQPLDRYDITAYVSPMAAKNS